MASPFTTYKLIILYMLQNSEGDLTNSQITDFILDRKYTNYFQLQQAVSELVEADLVEMSSQSNRTYYRLTEEGKNTLKYFSRELSSDIKKEVEEYLDLVIDCLEHLRPDIVIHRVTGDGPKDLLIAPLWASRKREVLNLLHHRMKERGSFQGKAL